MSCLWQANGEIVCDKQNGNGEQLIEQFYANVSCPPGKRCAKMEKYENDDTTGEEIEPFYARRTNMRCPAGKRCAKMGKFL